MRNGFASRGRLGTNPDYRLSIRKLSFLYFCFTVLLTGLAFSRSSTNILESAKPIRLLFLIDSSGSMKETDSQDIRKLAAQSILTMLSGDDQVAIVEFDETGRTVADWTPGTKKNDLYNAINKVGNKGEYTDFQAGLKRALDVFSDDKGDYRELVFLLSDGRFEPNLKSDSYSPYCLDFRREIIGKSSDQKKAVKSKYQEKILPVARRILESEIIPAFRQRNIEVFSVAFSPGADRETLKSISEATNLYPPEVHHYYAEKATDLVRVFAELLSNLKNLLVVHQEEGEFRPGFESRVFLDEFLDQAYFQFFTSQPAEIEIRNQQGAALAGFSGTHPNLKIFSVAKPDFPGEWESKFTAGQGDFREIVVGNSILALGVNGLKPKYLYGEQIEASIAVEIAGENALHLLNPNTRVQANIVDETGHHLEFKIEAENGVFEFRQQAENTGRFQIKFTLVAANKHGVEIRPRPSKEYAFEVLPDYYIEPNSLDFGNLKKGQKGTKSITIHSGYESRLELSMSSRIVHGSRGLDQVEKLPIIEDSKIVLEKPGIISKYIILSVPSNASWGDFEGELGFADDTGRTTSIKYRVHVPSWKEWITLSLAVLFILAVALLGYLAYVWGRLGTPRGVIRFLETPPGVVKEDVIIGRLNRGFITKYLNWKRNIVSIGGARATINLDVQPPEFLIRLKFYRFGGNYIENANSARVSDPVIIVKDPISDIEIERSPGQFYRLKSGTELVFKEYRVLFQDI